MNPPLDYMPPVQHRVRRTWPAQLAALAVMLGALVFGVAYDIGAILLIVTPVAGVLYWHLLRDAGADARWAYVLEGRSLTFRRPNDAGWATLQVDDVAAIFKVQQDDAVEVEIVFLNGRRVLVEAEVFGSLRRFMRGFRQLRPEIVMRVRSPFRCPKCARERYGTPLARCPDCRAHLPCPLPPIPADGVLLPKALPWL